MKKTLLLIALIFGFIINTTIAQTWGTLDAVDSLVVNKNLLGISSIYGNGSRVFLSSAKNDLTTELYYSDDGGLNWMESETSDQFKAGSYTEFSSNSESEIYAWGTSLFGVRNIKKSVDNGGTWTVTVPNAANFPFIFIASQLSSINDTLILTSTSVNSGILKSMNGGLNWEPFKTFSDNTANKSIESLFSFGSNFYLLAGSNGKGLFKSHKDSSKWEKIYSVDGIEESVNKAVVTKTGRIIIALDSGLAFSDDEGKTWVVRSREELQIGASGTIARMAIFKGELLLSIQDASAVGSRIMLVNNELTASTNISEGITGGTEFNLIATTNTQIFGNKLGETNKMWAYGAAPVNTSNEDISILEKFVLAQNYPNPFNPSTIISFNLPQASEVTLKVYNMLGQEVATLLNSRMSSGLQTVKFDASNLASGMYIYRLQVGSNIKTNKMMLIK
jgi:hypothetical protein